MQGVWICDHCGNVILPGEPRWTLDLADGRHADLCDGCQRQLVAQCSPAPATDAEPPF